MFGQLSDWCGMDGRQTGLGGRAQVLDGSKNECTKTSVLIMVTRKIFTLMAIAALSCGAAHAGDYMLRLLAVPMLSSVTDRVTVAAAPIALACDGENCACAYAADALPTNAVRQSTLSGVRLLRIDDSLRHVPDGAFERAPDLETVRFEGRVKTIGRRAFADSPRLSRLILDEALVTKIAADAFSGCATNLMCVYPFSPLLTAQDGPVANGEPLFRRIVFKSQRVSECY